MSTEYPGVPIAKVFVRKRPQQFVSPIPEFDFDMSSFYKKAGSPNVKCENVYFIEDLGVAMVQPLFTQRNNYIEGSVLPIGGYVSEHPGSGKQESETEVNRRVFVPSPTLTQYIANLSSKTTKAFSPFGSALPVDYEGPVFDNILLPPPQGCRRNVSWIYQRSAYDNVEWFMSQKEPNFQNQSFWIDIYKDKCVKTNADASNTDSQNQNDPMNRYYRYGRELRSYIAVRIGWDVENPQDYKNPRNVGGGRGPFDVVFPIGGTPFLWDHGGKSQDGKEEDSGNTGKAVAFDKNGFVSSEQPNWTLTDDEKYFRLMFFIVRGQLVIKTSFSEESWIFPQNSIDTMSNQTQDAYKNFCVEKGRVCIMGRGFKFRMSFNPLEFNIYKNGIELSKPHAKLTTNAVQDRKNYPASASEFNSPGWKDLYRYKENKGDFNNFFVIPNAENDYNAAGDHISCSYGMDINQSGTHTGMMIPVEGKDPHSSCFTPRSPAAVVWTELRDPQSRDKTSAITPVATGGNEYDFSLSRTNGPLSFVNQFIDIGMNCLKPDIQQTSARFASPVIWRLKGKNAIPEPARIAPIDITSIVKNISYSTTASDLETVRQEYTLDVYIPQTYQTEMLNLVGLSRDGLLYLLQNGGCEVEIYVGWTGGNITDLAMIKPEDDWGDYVEPNSRYIPEFYGDAVKVFSGLTSAGAFNQGYGDDVLQIKCFDKIKIIEEYKFLNSPFYDGMNVDDAFFHIGTLSGLPRTMFRCDSRRAATNVLGSGYTFTEPRFKFSEQETLFDAIKRISSQFWHVIRTDPNGIIVLTDLNASSTMSVDGDDRMLVLEDMVVSDPSYVFYVDGSRTHNPFQRMLRKCTLTKDNMQNVTNIEIFSVDKYDGAMILDTTAYNVDAIENPDAPNFIGYRKPMRITNSALGSREKVAELRSKLAKHVFQPQYTISFTTYGRPTLRPFDIIKIEFPLESAYASYLTNVNGEWLREMNFRVMAISGQIGVNSDMLHEMTVSATHI